VSERVITYTGVGHQAEAWALPRLPVPGEQMDFTTRQDYLQAHLSYWGSCIATERGYELYILPTRDAVQYYLRYRCPSTGKIYISGVPPAVGITLSIDAAIRWKFGLQRRKDKPLFTEES
jgi:hypothetical protein